MWQLGAGLAQPGSRLPPRAKVRRNLPTLAEVYVLLLGPVEILAGGPAAGMLPEEILGSLRTRWLTATAAYRPAARIGFRRRGTRELAGLTLGLLNGRGCGSGT